MKFRLVVTILTITILVLFVFVVKKSYDLKLSEMSLRESEASLLATNKTLVKQSKTIDSLYHVTEEQLESLERATDSVYFAVARSTNTFKSYKSYVANFGENGEYYHKALTNLNDFMPEKGYVQIQESGGKKYYSEYKDTKGFPEKAILIVGEPSVTKSNLIVLTQAMSVRNGVIGNPDFRNTGRNGHAVQVDQVVKLLDIIESGDAKWGHIAYNKNGIPKVTGQNP